MAAGADTALSRLDGGKDPPKSVFYEYIMDPAPNLMFLFILEWGALTIVIISITPILLLTIKPDTGRI
jgi:hypothetical protein